MRGWISYVISSFASVVTMAKGLEPVAVLILPGVPETGKREDATTAQLKCVRLFWWLPLFRVEQAVGVTADRPSKNRA